MVQIQFTSVYTQRISSLTETETFAQQLAPLCKDGAVIYLEGSLGVGKTTLVRCILRELGYRDKVKSPTYTLLETYPLPELTVVHCDLYRIKDPNELAFTGLYDYFDNKVLCFIEWPENGAGYLPPADLHCHLVYEDETENQTRELTLTLAEPATSVGKKIIKALHEKNRTNEV